MRSPRRCGGNVAVTQASPLITRTMQWTTTMAGCAAIAPSVEHVPFGAPGERSQALVGHRLDVEARDVVARDRLLRPPSPPGRSMRSSRAIWATLPSPRQPLRGDRPTPTWGRRGGRMREAQASGAIKLRIPEPPRGSGINSSIAEFRQFYLIHRNQTWSVNRSWYIPY